MARNYFLSDLFNQLVAKVRQNAPEGLAEVWGVVQYDGGSDFRLNLGRYRVIGVFPLASELAVLIEYDKVLRQAAFYQGDPDLDRLEDALGYLAIHNRNRLWIIRADCDLDDPYVDQFLACGMRLMVKEIVRRHPALGEGR